MITASSSNMTSMPDLPKPKTITGGCLCGAIRYRVNFPNGHDLAEDVSAPMEVYHYIIQTC